ncbi:MAG: hypothetical protein LBI53_07395 [Candidatus Peribacteria bacterium]|jgi:hypothetical protein|nr:hypothetical protein [Candidatus Peribacteria bacterium]
MFISDLSSDFVISSDFGGVLDSNITSPSEEIPADVVSEKLSFPSQK